MEYSRWTRLVGVGVLLAAVALSVGGCAQDDRGGGSASGGGTLRVAIAQAEPDLNSLDYKTHSFNILDQIYEPLVRYGANGTLQPGLAERWEVSADGLTTTFHLRRGVTFSDGTPFTAQAAKADLQRWLGQERHQFVGTTMNTASVDTPDATTLVLKAKTPYYPTLQELTYVRPVRFRSPSAYDASGALVKPIGTGPYRLESSTPTQVTLVRNDTYWGGRPSLDRVEFRVIPDSQARLAALKAGEVDVIGGDYLAPLAPEETRDLQGNSDVNILTKPSATNLLLAFNTTTGNPALADPKVREAINYAVDRDAYAKTLFNGLAKPASQLFPPTIPYAPAAGSRTIAHDAAKAASVLQAAGYTGSGTRAKGATKLQVRLILDPSLLPQAKALSEAVQADLAKVGITVTISSLDSTAYSDAASTRDYDLRFYLTYGPPYDPFGLLNADFRTREAAHLYATPALDAMIDKALASTTETDREAAYAGIWTQLNEAWAVVPLVETPRVWATRSTVIGFELGVTEYDLPLTKVSVSGSGG
jgi:nickel transport system substrate-binding protein